MSDDFANEGTDDTAATLLRNTESVAPQESIKTIERAERQNIHPDKYKDNEKLYKPESEIQERVPASLNKSTIKVMSKSSQHSNMIKDELGLWDKTAKQISYIGYNFTKKFKLEEEIFEWDNRDRLSKNGLEPYQYEHLDGLRSDLQKEEEAFELEGDEKLLGQAAGVATGMIRSIGNNKALAASTMAIGLAFAPFTLAAAGVVAGTSLAVTMAVDAYKKTAAGTFGELRNMTDEKGVPLNLSRDTMDNISTGVGVVAGSLELVTGKVITGGLGKLLTRKTLVTEVVARPALKVAMQLFGHTAKSAIASGGEEVSAELASIVGENFAQGSQDIEGFINALTVTKDQILADDKVDKKTGKKIPNPVQERLSTTFKVGALGGGFIAGGTGAIASVKAKKNIDADNLAIEKNKIIVAKVNESLKVLSTQDDFLNVAATVSQSKLNEMSPEQRKEVTKTMFEEEGVENKIFFNENDLDAMSENNPELVAKIREMDVTQSTEGETNSGAAVDPHSFIDLIQDAPEAAQYMRMNPEAPNPLESTNVLETLNEAEKQRQELFASLGVDGKLSPEQIKTLATLDEVVDAAVRENTVDNYVDEFPVPDSIKEMMGKDQLKNFQDAQARTRFEVADAVVQEFNQREQRIENKVVKANDKLMKQEQLRVNKRSLELVEKFKTENKKDFSPLAIDPQYLPADLKEAYLKDKKLKSRKAFKEGGVTLEESASMAGYANGEAMLKDLANAPTNKELAAQRKKRTKALRKEVKEVRSKSADVRLDELFNETAKLRIKEMDLMKTKEWASEKGVMRVIAFNTPILDEVNNEARNIVKKTKIGVLSPKQFNAGERALTKKSFSQIVKNEIEAAFMTKGKALLNSELTRESIRARKRINSDRKFIKRITSKKGIATMKSAGILQPVMDILDLFNLDTTVSRDEVDRKSYVNYIKGLAENGESVLVPEHLADVRVRGEDLTVEQHGKVVDTLRALEKVARLKNKLMKRNEKRIEQGKIDTLEAIAEDAALDLSQHPTFKPDRNKEDPANKNSRKESNKRLEQFNVGFAALTNMKNVVTELDQEALKGKHYENLVQGLVDSETFKRGRLSGVTKQIKSIFDDYGEKESAAAFNEFIEIPEFKDIEGLGFGTMARSDLWTLLAMTGDPDARNRIANFKGRVTGEPMALETLQRVLDKHLTEKDAKLVQNFTNIFKSFEDEARDLHFRSTGVEPTMVKGVPVHHRGKVYDGGYTPLNYLHVTIDEKLLEFLDIHSEMGDKIFGPKDGKQLYSNLSTAGQTEQGRLIGRTGSAAQLDTNFMNLLGTMEEHVHDLAYRESGRDALKTVNTELYKDAIIATVGKAKYDTIVNGIIETVGKVDNNRTSSTFSEAHRDFNKMYSYLEQGFAINALSFNWKSVAMQPLSLGTATLRMGPKGKRYLAKGLSEMMIAVAKGEHEAFFQAAVKINPDLATGRDNIDDTLTSSTYDFIAPTTNEKSSIRNLKKWKNKFAETGMLGLQKVDIQLKAAVSMAAYAQFVNGDVKNFSKAKLDAMSPLEVEKAAKDYVKQLSDLALTTSAAIDKSAVEKIAQMRLFTRFYTDVRSQLNTGFSQGRKVKNAVIQKDFRTASREASALMLIWTLNKMYTDTLYGDGDETPIGELMDVDSFDDFKGWLGDSVMYGVTAPAQVFGGSIPAVRDALFAAESFAYDKKVQNWIGTSMTDMVMGAIGLYDWITGQGLGYKEEKALISSTGLLVKGLPIKGLMRAYDDIAVPSAEFTYDVLVGLGEVIDEFAEENKDVESQQENIKAFKQIKKDIVPPQAQNQSVPDDAMESMALNAWDDLNPDTGAVGVYQFTEERWGEIAGEELSLGLTLNGRVSKDISQQEKAMKWELEDHAKGLAAYRVDVNIKTLYGAHRFGLDDYVAIELAGKNEKVEELVENEELFEGFTTVKEVKDFIALKIKNKDK